ncbi:MAG: hypothetical protein ACPIOQ_36365, partial [Promethearchaeia archaeon]
MPHALLSHHDGVWGARGRSLNKKNSNFLAGQQDSPVKGRRVGAGGPGEGDVGDVEEQSEVQTQRRGRAIADSGEKVQEDVAPPVRIADAGEHSVPPLSR